jgi:DNA-binding transcriptional LysR family regulator
VRLTRAGNTMLPEARLTLEQLDRTVRAAREAEAGTRGQLTVGFQWNAYPWIALARRQFEWEHPHVQVVYRQASFGDPTGGIADPDIDVAFVTPPFARQDGVHTTPLASEPRVVVVSNEHPWAVRSSISVTELVDAPMVTLNCADKVCRAFWELDLERGRPAQRLDPEPVTIDEWLNEIERGTHVAVTAAAAQHA